MPRSLPQGLWFRYERGFNAPREFSNGVNILKIRNIRIMWVCIPLEIKKVPILQSAPLSVFLVECVNYST